MEDFTKAFTEMAERIARMNPEEFAGALVFVPPEGDPLAILLAESPKPNLVQFWHIAETRVQIRKNEALAEASAPPTPFGRPLR